MDSVEPKRWNYCCICNWAHTLNLSPGTVMTYCLCNCRAPYILKCSPSPGGMSLLSEHPKIISFIYCFHCSLLHFDYLQFLTSFVWTRHVFYIPGVFFPAIKPSDTVFKITFWLGYLNSCINPIIYPCSSQEFKKAFQNVLRVQCLPRKQAANKHSLSFNLNHPASPSLDGTKDVVRIPVGSGETFYRISKSDGVCEWKIFSTMQSMSTKSATSKDKSGCARAKVKSKGFLRTCCCAGTSGSVVQENIKVPTIKIHTISLSENGEDV